ncbi:MAG TPA: hypothetical protein VGO93_08465 [Candidatus Xenobia bacterium]|jgi:predicted transcriptional regulator
MTAKEEIIELVKALPDDCTLEDIQYRLYVHQKIHSGLAAAERGEVISQEDLEKMASEWFGE